MVAEAVHRVESSVPEENFDRFTFIKHLFLVKGERALATYMAARGPVDPEENRWWRECNKASTEATTVSITPVKISSSRLRKRQIKAGLDGDLLNMTFENFDGGRSESQGVALIGCQHYTRKLGLRTLKRGVTLYGKSGVGKTHLAAAIVNDNLDSDQPLTHVWVECLELYNEEYRRAKEIEIKNADHVVLNDIDKALGGNTDEARLFVSSVLDKADKGQFVVTITSQIQLFGKRGPDGQPLLNDAGEPIDPGLDFYCKDYLVKRMNRVSAWKRVDGPDGRSPEYWPDESEPWAR